MLQQLRREYKVRRSPAKAAPTLFRSFAGARSCRSTESDDRAVPVRRSGRTDTHRLEQRIFAEERSLLAQRNADRRRRMFSDLPDQTSPLIPRNHCAATFPARGRLTSSPPQFGQMFCICSAQSRTKGAFIDANECRRVLSRGLSRTFRNVLSFPAPFRFVLFARRLIMPRDQPHSINSCTPATRLSFTRRAKRSSKPPPISSFGRKFFPIIATSVISNEA